MKSKIKAKGITLELSASGTFVIGSLWLFGYYLINGNLPEPSLNLNFSVPVVLVIFGGVAGNVKAWLNRYI